MPGPFSPFCCSGWHLGGGGGGGILVVMTLSFQRPQSPTFVGTANQMTSEMGMGHSGLALGWSH